ncbi:MAG: tetratricopeptide repeat protein [Acidimicrobiaceae bacterium]|nr:tetratricopeptide repeat protein [Acidimicrobiaceae bacterium]
MPGPARVRAAGGVIEARPGYVAVPMADVTDATFQAQVVDRSRIVPVIVDLWASWCEPCRQLTPILEKVIAETNGAVELAKVDIEANPGVAQAFRVQSIPAVYAMVDGQVADGFLGAQGEATVREFVQRFAPTPEMTEVERLIAAGDEASLRAALEIESDNPDAVAALASLLIDDDRGAEAVTLLERVPDTPEIRRLMALARVLDSDDAPTGGAQDIEAELAGLLATVKSDEEARQRFVDLLEVLGPDDPRTSAWRKRLSAALF